ncbi:MAG: FG-GAP repeat protein, partial [Planctomycetota bacterium]
MRNNALATLLALASLSVPAAGFQLCEQDLDSPLAAPLSGRFGRSVSASGPWVVVGAPRLFGSSATVGGSAVVYRRDSASDRLDFVVELSASDSTPDDRFGESVSIDGSRLVVGARRAESGAGTRGAAYVFEESGGVWNETQKIVPSTPASASNFGFSVGLSGDRIVVGQSAATVEVHRLDASGTWTLEEAVVADGEDVDIDGLTFSTLSGVFRRDPVFGSWIQEFSYTATSSAV